METGESKLIADTVADESQTVAVHSRLPSKHTKYSTLPNAPYQPMSTETVGMHKVKRRPVLNNGVECLMMEISVSMLEVVQVSEDE